jgi:hypothetical protein
LLFLKKKIISILLVAIAMTTIALSVSAATSTTMNTAVWDYGTNFSGTYAGIARGTYSPNKGTFKERIVVESATDSYFSFDAYFTFNQNIVSNLSNYKNNDNKYFTMDIANTNDRDTSMDAVYVYTTLPNPKVDLEDDPYPLGNNYHDEAEVVAQDLVSTNTQYTMYAHFEDLRRIHPSTSKVQLNSGLSTRSITGEYNTRNYYPLCEFNITSTYQGR